MPIPLDGDDEVNDSRIVPAEGLSVHTFAFSRRLAEMQSHEWAIDLLVSGNGSPSAQGSRVVGLLPLRVLANRQLRNRATTQFLTWRGC